MTKSDQASAAESTKREESKADDQRVLDLLEQARQNVKPIVKRELANEVITQEMMAFRFR